MREMPYFVAWLVGTDVGFRTLENMIELLEQLIGLLSFLRSIAY